MPSVFVPTTVRVARIEVLGKGWYGQVGALIIDLTDHDLENIGEFNRDSISDWLDSHTGDFQSIIDFSVTIGIEQIPFESEDNQNTFCDCMYGGLE